MKLGVLVSGRGSNLAAVLDAIDSGALAVDPVVVISNRAAAPALEVARAHGVSGQVLSTADFADRETRDAAIGAALRAAGAGIALLAGFDQVLRASYFEAFAGPTINIHPSLLPRHGGPGMVGAAVHAAVLAAGDAESGATVHLVAPAVDAGPILAQVRVPVEPGDVPATLAARVLAAEHRLVVETLAGLVRSGARLDPSASMAAASRPGTEAPAPH
jgi:phosphoribosylglycinamide formyltransferase-1